jgi:hypothetical protein
MSHRPPEPERGSQAEHPGDVPEPSVQGPYFGLVARTSMTPYLGREEDVST